MRLDLDVERRTAAFEISSAVYSRKAIEVAAHVLERRVEVSLGKGRGGFSVTLKALRPEATRRELEGLAGEFLNELLNQEYRFLVGRFNRKITDLALTQALYSARGGETPPPKADESDPAFQADVARMLEEAAAEIKRSMPKRIPPQGTPLPPPKEESLA